MIKDWTAAIIGGEDWAAAMDSEIFRNYALISKANEERELAEIMDDIKKKAASEEQLKLEEANKKKFEKDTKEVMKDVIDSENNSRVPTPIIPNLPYGDYQEHIKARRESPNVDESGSYYAFFPDYRVKQKAASEFDFLKQALDETADETAVEETEKDEDVETEELMVEVPYEEQIKEDVEKIEKDTPEDTEKHVTKEIETFFPNKVPKEFKETHEKGKRKSLYDNTGAGKSDHIYIGVTNETEKLMNNGFMGKQKKMPKEKNEPEITKEQIMEARAVLGLNKNARYILSQLKK